MNEADKYQPSGPFCVNELGVVKKLIDFLGGFITTGRNHREVHEGEFFTFGYTFLAVADDAIVDLRFLTGAKQFHYGIQVDAEGKALASIYRGTTYSADGTAVPTINNSCASANTALLTPFQTPTVNVLGALLTPVNGLLVPGGLGPQTVGSSVKTDEERVSAVDQDYLIRVQNVSGQPKDITILVGGYESGTILT